MTTPIIVFSDFQKAMNTGNSSALLKSRARELIEGVSSFIEATCGRRFDRYYATRSFSSAKNENGGSVSADGFLLLDDDLAEIGGLINNHTESVDPADYTLFPTDPTAPSKDMIKLKNNLVWLGNANIGIWEAVQVTGFWGYGGSFKRQCELTADIDDQGLTLTVDDTTGIELGHMLRMGDELLYVDREVTIPGTSIHVERAYNGSLPEAHLTADGVYLFRADPTARRLANRICKWQSALDDNPLIALVTVGDAQEPIDLSAAPKDVEGMINLLIRPESVGSA